MNLGDRIRDGVKWLLLGTIGNRLLEFIFGIILARLLVPADFGMVITLQLFTGVVGIIASGGMGLSLVRTKQVDENDFNTVFTLQLAMGVAVYLGFFLLAPAVGRFFDDPRYVDLLRVSALVLIIRPLALMRNAWLTREMAFKKRTTVMVVTSLTTGASGSLMALAGMGAWALVLSGLLAALVRNLLLARITPLQLRLHLDNAIIRRHAAFGFKVTALELLGDFKKRLEVLLLTKIAGPAFLGLYNKAHSLSQLPANILIPPVGQPLFRAMSKIQNDLDQTKYLFFKVVTVLAAFVFPFFTLLWWIAEPFVLFVYGEKWLPSAAPLEILVLAGFFFTLEIPCGVLLTAQNRMTPQIFGQILNLIGIGLACTVGLQWGLIGVAWGITATNLVATGYALFWVFQTISASTTDYIRAVQPGISMNIALFVVLLMVDSIISWLGITSELAYLVIMSVVGGSTYLVMLLYLPFESLQNESSMIKARLVPIFPSALK